MAWVTFVITNHCYKSCSTSTKRENQLLKTSPFHTSWSNSLPFLLLAYVCISWFSSAKKMLACIKIEKKKRCTEMFWDCLLWHQLVIRHYCPISLTPSVHRSATWGKGCTWPSAEEQWQMSKPCPPHHCWACRIAPKWRLKQKLPPFQKELLWDSTLKR